MIRWPCASPFPADRVRSFVCAPVQAALRSGPVTSESVWGMGTCGLRGARLMVLAYGSYK